MSQILEVSEWEGRTAVGRDGEKLGKIREIYLDDLTDKPEWATVSGGFLGTKSHFVPLAGVLEEGEDLHVLATKAQVEDAPSVDADEDLSEAEERRLFEHYGVPYTSTGSSTAQGSRDPGGSRDLGREGGEETSGSDSEGAMTRSEEEVRVGTAQRERGRARLRKYVVTEQVQKTVPVQREEVRLEREPITDANVEEATARPEISESEHEVVLHEEEPVIQKRTVPKERVRLEKDTVTDEREVSEEIRKEQIEPEGDIRR
jgi:uncharacterized protein (TIGR02271 family)